MKNDEIVISSTKCVHRKKNDNKHHCKTNIFAHNFKYNGRNIKTRDSICYKVAKMRKVIGISQEDFSEMFLFNIKYFEVIYYSL